MGTGTAVVRGGCFMQSTHDHVLLTSSELTYMWTTYLADSMASCVFQHFLTHIEDEEIKALIRFAKQLSDEHVQVIHDIFTREKIQVPQGFTKKDINRKAKRLFSDVFYLNYLKNMLKGGLITYGRVLQNVYRPDILTFFNTCLMQSIDLNTRATQLLLEKGLSVRPPTIPYPEKVEFVHKQSFLLEGLGRREALTGAEVNNLFSNIQTNYMGSALATAFCQVAKDSNVRKYFQRGKKIALKHVEVLSSYLKMDSLPVPGTCDQQVTESKEPPFSDKLMMFHFTLMIYAGIGNYGVSISESQRSDLIADYARINLEVLKYSEDGANLMVSEKWLEQPPLAAKRN
jgi:hypothetical protein